MKTGSVGVRQAVLQQTLGIWSRNQCVGAGIELVLIGKNIFPAWIKLNPVTTVPPFDPGLLLQQRVVLFFNVFQNICQLMRSSWQKRSLRCQKTLVFFRWNRLLLKRETTAQTCAACLHLNCNWNRANILNCACGIELVLVGKNVFPTRTKLITATGLLVFC
jgi:hypothetical protein